MDQFKASKFFWFEIACSKCQLATFRPKKDNKIWSKIEKTFKLLYSLYSNRYVGSRCECYASVHLKEDWGSCHMVSNVSTYTTNSVYFRILFQMLSPFTNKVIIQCVFVVVVIKRSTFVAFSGMTIFKKLREYFFSSCKFE